MINSIKQALTTRDIRRKLEIIVGIIFLTRVISMIPVPGVDASVFKQWMASNSNDALNLSQHSQEGHLKTSPCLL